MLTFLSSHFSETTHTLSLRFPGNTHYDHLFSTYSLPCLSPPPPPAVGGGDFPSGAGPGHLPCFHQWNTSRCSRSRGLKFACGFWFDLVCSKNMPWVFSVHSTWVTDPTHMDRSDPFITQSHAQAAPCSKAEPPS